MRLPWVRSDEEKERDSFETRYVEDRLRAVMDELRETLEAAAREIDEIAQEDSNRDRER